MQAGWCSPRVTSHGERQDAVGSSRVAVAVAEDGDMQRRDVVILGSTGSIGTQALDVVRRNPDRFRVVGLTAGGSRPELFAEQVAELRAVYPRLWSGLGGEA